MADPRRIIIGITGATGTILGVRLLQLLQGSGVETHLMISQWGARTLLHETPFTMEKVQKMASRVHPISEQGADISSGSFATQGMVIAPCSMKTLASIACGVSQNLIHRAADVTMKEQRKLVLVVREAPLNQIHLENMLRLARMGVVIYPLVPSFYNNPSSIDDMVTYLAVRVLDQLGVRLDGMDRWDGVMKVSSDYVQPDTEVDFGSQSFAKKPATS